jgi:hypothetical protein
MWPVQVGIVKLHARLTATHALNGLAAFVWCRAPKARIGITLAWSGKRPQELSNLRMVVRVATHATPISMLNAPSARCQHSGYNGDNCRLRGEVAAFGHLDCTCDCHVRVVLEEKLPRITQADFPANSLNLTIQFDVLGCFFRC